MKEVNKNHHDILGMIAAYAGGVLVTALVGVVIFGHRPAFMTSSASAPRYIGPAICDPTNSNARCQNDAPTITSPATLPSGTRGRAYQYQFTAQGGTAPYTWQVSTDNGLNWYPCCTIALQPNGVFASVSGSPVTIAGTFQVGVRVTDSKGLSATSVHSFTIDPDNVGGPLTITGASQLPSGEVGQSYYHQFEFSGGTGPYIWSLSPVITPNPSYPAGCMRFSPTGVLSGCTLAPSMPYAGTYQVAVVLQDSTQAVQRTFTFKINPAANGSRGGIVPTIVPTLKQK